MHARPSSRARARHDAGRCPGDGAGAPGARRRPRGRCQAAREPRRLVRALHALCRDRSQPRAYRRRRALAGRHRLRPSVRRRGGAARGSCSPACGARAWLPKRRSPMRPGPPGRSPATAMRRSCRRAAPGWRWLPCPWPRSAWTPMPSTCWSVWGSSGSRAFTRCRAGRWSRASARRSPRGSIRRRVRPPSRSRRARRRRRIAPSWPSPSRSPRPRRWSR